jgi:ribosomal protein S5
VLPADASCSLSVFVIAAASAVCEVSSASTGTTAPVQREKASTAGTGLKAGGAMRAVLESVGIKDVIAKSKGSSNAHNLVKATIAALAEMRDAYTVAGERGISMDKVFNG